jgi:hypothetical protein
MVFRAMERSIGSSKNLPSLFHHNAEQIRHKNLKKDESKREDLRDNLSCELPKKRWWLPSKIIFTFLPM